MPSALDEKWGPFNFFFSVQGTGGSPTGPDPENRMGDQDIGKLAIRYEHTPLSNDTIDSVLRHRELVRAKDLPAPPRIAHVHRSS
jgi:hypothetical protein